MNENRELATAVFKKYKKKIGKDFKMNEHKTKDILKKWYYITYKNPLRWHIAKYNYAKTLAIMSALGYFKGLGDRHCENILEDVKNGDIVHVDLNLLFDRGKKLIVPERVPFRLTKNLRSSLGVFKEESKFKFYMTQTFKTLLRFKDVIYANLLAFVYDPIAEIKRPEDMIKRLFEKIRGDIEDQLVIEAVDEKKLCEMYVGWMPFI